MFHYHFIPQILVVAFMMLMLRNQTKKHQDVYNKEYENFIIGFAILSMLLLWSWL